MTNLHLGAAEATGHRGSHSSITTMGLTDPRMHEHLPEDPSVHQGRRAVWRAVGFALLVMLAKFAGDTYLSATDDPGAARDVVVRQLAAVRQGDANGARALMCLRERVRYQFSGDYQEDFERMRAALASLGETGVSVGSATETDEGFTVEIFLDVGTERRLFEAEVTRTFLGGYRVCD